MPEIIPCNCGCGGTLARLDSRGRPRRYLPGHSWRGKERPTHKKACPGPSAARAYARRRVRQRQHCELAHIGHCLGRLDVAHVDHNYLNNDPGNLKTLCRSHHFLYDKGRIDLMDPRMPRFYVDRSGKRRYTRGAVSPCPTETTCAHHLTQP